ncbi:Fic/DOC family protein [Marinobacter nauticus]|jgi:Protein involved in cell division|uniref:protein adenylyltransferase n=1 Tax=Marinobacter nauticus (strain ATCC 700491 / DSM 11845 / VT8) TaxID=351348 RepID=A1U633_MARN8|nr:Fic family protein [Marinobacter nauticus]ABM20452.1 filamentation induced by cAMP protein Fic [Marinobacter nauticus VT8]
MSRYDITGSEGEYEPGSDNKVLRNLPGITDPEEMNIVETDLLEDLYLQVFDNFPEELTFETLCQWHRAWLGNVYSWAGQSRTVDMSKPNIRFASPVQIPKLAEKFEARYLPRFAELPEMTDEELVAFLAEVHVEFILIHPFREGNGRISRLLLDVMAAKAGAEPLDYSLWDEHKDFYFKAIQAGRDGDYQHVERLIRDVLEAQQ